MAKKYTDAQKKAYAKRMRNKRRNVKKFQIRRQSQVNWPLMPETRLAKLNYTTRIRIDPPAVKAGSGETANNMAIHTLVLNSMYSPDYTTGSTVAHSKSGAPKHQPRMYDQWSTFYEYATVVGSKVRMTFTTKQHIQNFATTHTASGTLTGIPIVREPYPCAIGFLKREYEQNVTPALRFDDVCEKKQIVMKKTTNKARSYNMVHKWSLKQDPLYKTELHQSNTNGSDVSWGASFGQDVGANNKRYLHIFANPLSTNDDEDPQPIDVLIQMEQIVLMSNLRDVAQSH